MSPPLTRPERYTYADYCRWPDAIRGELIDGVFHAMSPSPDTQHQSLVLRLGTQLELYFRGKPCRAFIAPFDVRLPPLDRGGTAAEGDDETVVQPDLLVVCDPAKLDERGCRGTPDWIIEVLSPSTAEPDLTVKRELYERHGVREYWAVSPKQRTVTQFRQHGPSRFADAAVCAAVGEMAVALFPGLRIDWGWAFEE